MDRNARPESDKRFRNDARRLWFAVLASALMLQSSVIADTSIPRERLPISWQDDAELTDACFLDASTGWAVGAQGLILKTTDGGRTWFKHGQAIQATEQSLSLEQKLQNMRQGKSSPWTGRAGQQSQLQPLRCRFESVWFADEKHGWVAGGYNVPWVDQSRAVLMRTSDGGVTWDRVSGLMIPRIHKIRFTTLRQGWAIGDATHLYPTGIYFTSDGGRTWSGGSNVHMSDWRDAVQVGSKFVVVNKEGHLAVVSGNKIQWSAMINCPSDARVNCVHMIDDQNGWAAGDRGLLVRTDDGGVSWQRFEPPEKLSEDIQCIASTVDHLWLAGNPGNVIFRLGKRNAEITRIELPQYLPIHQLTFMDAQHGFAVGDLSTILATTDGGATWNRQFGQHQRLALLAIARRPIDIPLEVISRNAGEENRVCGLLVTESKPAETTTAIQAAERVGSSVNWTWAPGDRGASPDEQFSDVKRLARAIRVLRPAVVVCSDDSRAARNSDSQHSLEKMVRHAMALAEHDAQGSDSIDRWKVQRLVVSDPAGEISLDPDRMLPTLGIPVLHQTSLSRSLLNLPVSGLRNHRYRVTADSVRPQVKGDDLLSGLGSAARNLPRRSGINKLGNLNEINESLARKKQLEQFASVDVATDDDRANWRQQLQAFSLSLDETHAGLWLFELAERYIANGQFSMAADTLEILTTRWPGDARAPAAQIWLCRYYSSQELAGVESGQCDEQAARLIGQLDPELRKQPHVRWTEAKVLSRLSADAAAVPAYEALRSAVAQRDRLYSDAADRELRWLAAKSESDESADAVAELIDWTATTAEQPPHLDGKLDDPIWQSILSRRRDVQFPLSKTLPVSVGLLQPTDARTLPSVANTDQAMFAIDGRFFYAAFRCQKLPGQSYRFARSARPRDPDLSRRDRVELEIDVDRDYGSSVTFVVDHRGWVAEKAWGSHAWNPDWYVAQAEDEDSWTVEIAIPLECFHKSEIRTPLPDQSWAIRVDRLDRQSMSLWHASKKDERIRKRSANGFVAGLQIDPARFGWLGFVD